MQAQPEWLLEAQRCLRAQPKPPLPTATLPAAQALQPPTPNTSPISVRHHGSATAQPPPDLLQACSAAEGAPQTGSWAGTSNTVSPSNPLELSNIEKLLKTQKQRVAGGRIWAIITCSILSLKNPYINFPPSLPSTKSVALVSGKCQTWARAMCWANSPKKCSGYIAIQTLILKYRGQKEGTKKSSTKSS